MTTALLVLVLDLVGTFVFAVEGASAASGGHFDLLGVLVLSFATALGGGIARDVLLGVPPAAIRDWRYPAVALSGGVVVFLLHGEMSRLSPTALTVLDAMGLSLCAVAGAEKALANHLHPLLATLLGAVTGVGGGTLRDVLMGRSPRVLHSDVYAVAAIAGAAALIVAQRARLPPQLASLIGFATCFGVRMLAVSQHWNLPQLG